MSEIMIKIDCAPANAPSGGDVSLFGVLYSRIDAVSLAARVPHPDYPEWMGFDGGLFLIGCKERALQAKCMSGGKNKCPSRVWRPETRGFYVCLGLCECIIPG